MAAAAADRPRTVGSGPFRGPALSTPFRAFTSVRHVVERVRVRAGAPVLAAVEPVDGADVVRLEPEVEQLEVLLHAGAVDRLREDDAAALDVPAQHHLGRC